ncbi:hypothetical protein C8Q74DRAFT_179290 [Fomes fomentarius]|nr:hypothetical protein C8Q74DRAFT_179290 [Fomes fomentarius]
MELGAPLVEQYKRKSREFKTKDRVYCHNPTCSAFLGGATATPAALRCTECHSETCGSCKDAAHDGQTCDARHDEVMLEYAKGQGWQRCPACKHLVELTEGCYHMTCRCEKQFCYLCAAVWKTCECPLFHVPDEEPAAAQTVA